MSSFDISILVLHTLILQMNRNVNKVIKEITCGDETINNIYHTNECIKVTDQ